MSGIVFMKTRKQSELLRFYTDVIGCELWMDQGGCHLFRHGNFILGFCAADRAETEGILTFFYQTPEEVDSMFEIMKSSADGPPRRNDRYQIYQFFAKDPEGRTLEFQYFLNPVSKYLTCTETLKLRRSIRNFSSQPVPEKVILSVLESCRFAPTSMNSQSCFYKIITKTDDLAWLSRTRGQASSPLGKAPVAVAVCSDPSITKRPEQDADIAAYHFMLAAKDIGLGTCWIAALNRDDLKQRLEIPLTYYIATVTPVGWPETTHEIVPKRRKLEEMIL